MKEKIKNGSERIPLLKHSLAALFFAFALLAMLSGCSKAKYKYPALEAISMPDGFPIDSIAPNYILDSIKFHDDNAARIWDKQNKQIINQILSFASEPILYNYFLKRDIYRFVINHDNAKFLIVDISSKGQEYWLSTKKITMEEDGEYKLVFRSYDLTEEQLGFFMEKWNDEWQNIRKSSKQDKYSDSFIFIEMHTKDDYLYFIEPLSNSATHKLIEWVTNNSRLKID